MYAKKIYFYALSSLAIVGVLAMTAPALAASNQNQGNHFGFFKGRGQLKMDQMHGRSGVFGTVSNLNVGAGTFTVTGKAMPNSTTAAPVYNVTATATTPITMTKNGTTSTVEGLSNITDGDTVSVKGSVDSSNNVTNVTAIRDGVISRGGQGLGAWNGQLGIYGTVQSANLNSDGSYTFMINAVARPNAANAAAATTTTYTVTAASTVPVTGNVTALSGIKQNDTISVRGTVNTANDTVVAASIRDGQMTGRGFGKGTQSGAMPQNLAITGNGQPVVAGTVLAINGNSVTITNKSNVTYTVDATSAKITQGQNTIQVSGLKTGDSVVVQGAVNGQAVTASSIIDQTRPAGTATASGSVQAHSGFMGSIGQFFMHLFGF